MEYNNVYIMYSCKHINNNNPSTVYMFKTIIYSRSNLIKIF